MPGIASCVVGMPIQAIASSVSAASGASMSRSSWIIRPMSMLWPNRIDRATVCSAGSVSGSSR